MKIRYIARHNNNLLNLQVGLIKIDFEKDYERKENVRKYYIMWHELNVLLLTKHFHIYLAQKLIDALVHH